MNPDTRREQARAEAERRVHTTLSAWEGEDFVRGYVYGFTRGAEWAAEHLALDRDTIAQAILDTAINARPSGYTVEGAHSALLLADAIIAASPGRTVTDARPSVTDNARAETATPAERMVARFDSLSPEEHAEGIRAARERLHRRAETTTEGARLEASHNAGYVAGYRAGHAAGRADRLAGGDRDEHTAACSAIWMAAGGCTCNAARLAGGDA